jgi:hypothetical protein
MASPRLNSFEGGTNNTNITTTNSGGASGDAFDGTDTASATLQFSSAQKHSGTLSGRCTYTGSNAYANFGLGFSPTTTRTRTAFRFYVYLTSGGTFTTHELFTVLDSTLNEAPVFVGLDASTKLQIKTNARSTVSFTATSALPKGAWYRIEVAVTIGSSTSNGAIDFAYYLGDSTTPVQSFSSSSLNLGTLDIGGGFFGNGFQAVASARTNYYDDIAIQELSSGFIGPLGTDASVSAALATASGSAQNPTITADGTVTPPASTGTGQAYAPAVGVSADSSVAPPAALATADAYAPDLSAGAAPAAPTAAASVGALAPAVSADALVLPDPATVDLHAQVPDVAAAHSEAVAPPAATAAVAALTPGVLAYRPPTASEVAVDSISVVVPALDDLALDVKSWTVTMDGSRAPYIEAALTVATPANADALDPTAALRVLVTLGKVWDKPVRDPQSLELDLYLHRAGIESLPGETELVLRSDEAVLIDDMQTTVDHSYEGYTDLRTFISDELTRYGYTLEPGTVTADITRTANATNMFADPGTTASAGNANIPGGGFGVTNANLDSNDATWSISPDGDSFNVWGPTGTDSFLYTGSSSTATLSPFSPGQTYTVSATGNVKVALTGSGALDTDGGADPRARRICIVGYSPTWPGGYIMARSSAVPNTVGAATRVSATFTVPPDTTGIQLRFYLGASTGQIRWDGFRSSVSTGIDDASYFDGSGAHPVADPHYAYAWTGTANASTSTRVRLDTRSPDALTRIPGQKAWDYIQPKLDAAGLQLYCDETRRWYLVPQGYTVDGQISVTEARNLTSGTSTIDLGAADLGGGPAYFKKVVVHYTWLDSTTGQQTEAYDAAGSGIGPGSLIEVNAPYPGPGAAAAILARGQNRKRTIDVSALSDLRARPGMAVAVSMPGIPDQVGTLASVTWTDQDEMRLGVRGSSDTPPGSWAFAEGEWSAATGDWAHATGTN